ncbi:exosortase A [Duganella aceris]|nr:exosortase A [Duganella aceris]
MLSPSPSPSEPPPPASPRPPATPRPPASPHPAASPCPTPVASRWPIGCIVAALCLLLAAHIETFATIVGLWWRSSTFAHGFIVPPVAAWLIWRRRAYLAAVPHRPWPAALPALATLGAIWLPSTVANVPVLQQYCVVLMLPVIVAAVLGRAYAAAIAFPLAYLLLAVPFGEVFIPPLIDFTARFTVMLLQVANIPVFRENNYLSLPTGNWSVVDACSGLRYLIASVALGTLYAYLNYRSLARRLIFVAASVVVPVVANGLRACMIVLIGHWSDRTLAVGIDHLIYGWVFFGMVTALMFWCGARWRQSESPVALAVDGRARLQPAATPAGFVRITVAAATAIAIWPLLAMLALQSPRSDASPEPQLTLPPPPAPWRASPPSADDWSALHAGKPQRLSANYSDGRRTVSLQLIWYRHQVKGAELLTPEHRLAPGQAPWSEISATRREIQLARRVIQVRQSIEQTAGVTLLVWRWYRLDGRDTASPQLVKLLLAKAKLSGGDDGGAEIVLASAYEQQTAPAEAAMRDLLAAMLPSIDQGLRHVAIH